MFGSSKRHMPTADWSVPGETMNPNTCHLCHHMGPRLRKLVQPETGEGLRVCVTCLHTTPQAKAAWSDQRGRQRLIKAAVNGTREVWRSDHVLYLMPPMAKPSASDAGTSPQPPQPSGER